MDFKPLHVRILRDGRTVELLDPYTYHHPHHGKILVPAGFRTDFASVPRLFWRVVPPWGRYSPAAAVHDYLYATGQMSRRDADVVFYDKMIALGVNKAKAWTMYRAVRMFGGLAWRNWRKRDAVE